MPGRRVLVFCSGVTGAGTTTAVVNVAGRLAAYGEVLLLECDLGGPGIAGIVEYRRSSTWRASLGDVLQDGVHLSPGALLDSAARLELVGLALPGQAESFPVWLLPGQRRGEGAVPDQLAATLPRGDASVGSGLCDRHEASRRLDELLSVLAEWTAAPGTAGRWVIVDVPPHPFVAPQVLRAVTRAAMTNGGAGLETVVPVTIVACFAWNTEHVRETRRLTERFAKTYPTIALQLLCTRGALGQGDSERDSVSAATEARLSRDIATYLLGRDSNQEPGPTIPFASQLCARCGYVSGKEQVGAGTGVARAYDAVADWVRSLDA